MSGWFGWDINDSTDVTWSPDWLNASRFQNDKGNGIISSLRMHFSAPIAGHVRLGVYSDNAGLPGALLVDAGQFVVAAGWVTATGLSIPVVADAWYWLAFIGDDIMGVDIKNIDPGLASYHQFKALAYGALPNPFGVPDAEWQAQQEMQAYVSSTAFSDVTTRFKTTVQKFKDISTRFLLNVKNYRDIPTRFALQVLSHTDVPTRFKLEVQSYLDTTTRFLLNAKAYGDISTRFLVNITKYVDSSTRFSLTILRHIDITTRFIIMVGGLIDVATRFRLIVTATPIDINTRFFLYVPTWKEVQIQAEIADLNSQIAALHNNARFVI
jgi:hypothetical protein